MYLFAFKHLLLRDHFMGEVVKNYVMIFTENEAYFLFRWQIP